MENVIPGLSVSPAWVNWILLLPEKFNSSFLVNYVKRIDLEVIVPVKPSALEIEEP
jgi:hypothetical protein